MMYHEQQEQFGKLLLALKKSTEPVYHRPSYQTAKDADVNWDASRFWALAMFKSKPLNYHIKYSEYLIYKANYESINKVLIDETKLFENFWLRKVLGYVKIAGSISFACFRFNRSKAHKNEIEFLIHFSKSKNPNDTIEESEFIEEKKEYEATHHVTLSMEAIYSSHMASLKEGRVKLSDIENYFKPYIDYWNELDFICSMIDEKEKGLTISILQFEELRNGFEVIYPGTPKIQEFEDQKIITRQGENFIINFYNDSVKIWEELNDKIAGLLWEYIYKDSSFKNSEEKVSAFLDKVYYWNHWPDFIPHCTSKAGMEFLKTALSLVTNDNDLKGIDREIEKAQIDYRDHMPFAKSGYLRSDFLLRNTDLFELMTSLNNWHDKGHGDILYHQGTREIVSFLINAIVCNDPNFDMIKVLLRSGIDRPFILWQTTQFIIRRRIEAIPDLLVVPDLMTVGISIIDQIGMKTEPDNNKELWAIGVNIVLQSLSKDSQNYSETAKIAFQIYRQLNHKKYEINIHGNIRKGEDYRRSVIQMRETQILSMIESLPLHNGRTFGGSEMYLLPALYNDLVHLFNQLEEESFYRNGTIAFPMLKWDGMIWLMKCSTYWKYKSQNSSLALGQTKLIESFLQSYLSLVEINKIQKNTIEVQETQSTPYWSERLERLERIEWIYPIYLLDKDDMLGKFLAPDFVFVKTEDEYHEGNRFVTDKLRTHIGVLLQILRKLVLPSIPYGFDKKKLEAIKDKIEKRIIFYLREVWQEDSTKGNDLFEHMKEWGFNNSNKEALLPQIAQAVNWFSDKEEITRIFTESSDIEKILTLLDSITSEGIKKRLLERIKELDVKTVLQKANWLPEVKNILIRISHYPELIDQIQEVVNYWETKVTSRRKENEYKIPLYNTKLLLAYFQKDIPAIDKLEEPDNAINSYSQLSFHNYKEFYKALIIMGDKPQESYRIFDSLCKQYPLYKTLALNRMAAKVRQAFQDNNNLELYREALEEWNLYESNSENKDFKFEEPQLSINKLDALFRIGEYTEMDKVYENLDLPDKMVLRVLEIRTDALIAQKRINEALIMLDSAELYHQFANLADTTFISELKLKVKGDDVLEVLQTQYSRIFDSRPDTLIKILPEYLNGKIELYDFITQEVIYSLSGMLDKVKSVSEIKNEDKYNDILELTLGSRMYQIGWQVHGQSRGAFSSPKKKKSKQPGERDLVIKSKNAVPLTVCEAFVYRGASTAKSHLQKILNYYHKRESFIVLIYDTGRKGNDFQKNWLDYSQTIIPKVKFPKGYELIGDLKEVEKDFEFGISAIKVGVTNHASKTKLYHVFVNIDYKVSPNT